MTVAALDLLPGLEKVRARFFLLLEERQLLVAQHTLAAWDATSTDQVNENLRSVQHILHQIAGSAGSIGFADLGSRALECEMLIISHLEGPDADLALCPEAVGAALDGFVAECLTLREASAA